MTPQPVSAPAVMVHTAERVTSASLGPGASLSADLVSAMDSPIRAIARLVNVSIVVITPLDTRAISE